MPAMGTQAARFPWRARRFPRDARPSPLCDPFPGVPSLGGALRSTGRVDSAELLVRDLCLGRCLAAMIGAPGAPIVPRGDGARQCLLTAVVRLTPRGSPAREAAS